MAQDPCLNLQLLGSESTSFTLDNMGRFLCNTLQEALCSAEQTIAGRLRGLDVTVIVGHAFCAKETAGRSQARWCLYRHNRLDLPRAAFRS